MDMTRVVHASNVFGMPTRTAAREGLTSVTSSVVPFGDSGKFELSTLHPALYAKSHVSNFLFQCRSAGHLLQKATP